MGSLFCSWYKARNTLAPGGLKLTAWHLEKTESQAGTGETGDQRAEPGAGSRTPATIPNQSVQGRSPGSQVLIHRLPKPEPSGSCGGSALIYRCGGSRGFVEESFRRTSFPFNPAAEKPTGHLEQQVARQRRTTLREL